jgi:hypothetical protein
MTILQEIKMSKLFTKWLTGAVLTAASLGAHAALDPAQVPPVGASVGTFSLPLTCGITVPLLGNLKVWNLKTSVSISGAVPSTVGPGQRFYLSQASGTMTLPAWITTLAPLIGAKSADVVISEINISAVGASPETINMATSPLVLSAVPIVAGKPLTAGLPTSGVFTVGPWTAPASGLISVQFLGANASVDMLNSKGNKIITVKAQCSAPANTALLSLEVGGQAGQPDALIDNVFVKYPAPAVGYDNGVIDVGYHCTLDDAPADIGIAFGAVSPLSLASGAKLQYKNADGALVFPTTLVNSLVGQGVGTVSATLRKLVINTEGGSPASVDIAAKGPLSINAKSLAFGQSLVVAAPEAGYLTVDPVARATSTAQIRMSAGEAEIDLYYNGNQQAHRLSCAAPTPRIFLGASPL